MKKFWIIKKWTIQFSIDKNFNKKIVVRNIDYQKSFKILWFKLKKIIQNGQKTQQFVKRILEFKIDSWKFRIKKWDLLGNHQKSH